MLGNRESKKTLHFLYLNFRRDYLPLRSLLYVLKLSEIFSYVVAGFAAGVAAIGMHVMNTNLPIDQEDPRKIHKFVFEQVYLLGMAWSAIAGIISLASATVRIGLTLTKPTLIDKDLLQITAKNAYKASIGLLYVVSSAAFITAKFIGENADKEAGDEQDLANNYKAKISIDLTRLGLYSGFGAIFLFFAPHYFNKYLIAETPTARDGHSRNNSDSSEIRVAIVHPLTPLADNVEGPSMSPLLSRVSSLTRLEDGLGTVN